MVIHFVTINIQFEAREFLIFLLSIPSSALKAIYHGNPNYIIVVENFIVGVTVIAGETTEYIGYLNYTDRCKCATLNVYLILAPTTFYCRHCHRLE